MSDAIKVQTDTRIAELERQLKVLKHEERAVLAKFPDDEGIEQYLAQVQADAGGIEWRLNKLKELQVPA